MKRFLTVLFLVLVSSVAHAQPQIEKAVSATVLTEAKEGGYKIISLQELERDFRNQSGSLLLVDTRQEWAYQMQHITGASCLPVSPTWWYQYSPSARSEMRKVLGSDINKKAVFY
jgi:hypothetical protein